MNIQKLLHEIFATSWWVVAFVFICTISYEQGLKKRDLLYQQLMEQSAHLQKEKREALCRQQSLQMQMNSQSDLAWIELTLMKGLGLVPENQKKVYFYSKTPEL